MSERSVHIFLFTDIEGSTQRWEADREAMSAALARHDRILRSAIEDRGGRVFKTVGDAFYSVFSEPAAALDAAIDAQRALEAEDWPAFGADFAALRVRMALHSGLAEERGGDYFGPALNRVARLLSSGHGGQILVSNSTEQLVGELLPAGASLYALGTLQLKDLARSEQVFQLSAEGLAQRFPPLRQLARHSGNLPRQATSFIGRAKELAELREMLEHSRLVTLTGIGGIGKTRLALEAAASQLERHPDGVWLVDLSPLTEDLLVLPALAGVLGLREEEGRPLDRVLRDALRSRRALFVLDNCEHLLDGAARLAELVLTAGPNLCLIATSRERLAIAGEACLPLAPFASPPAGGHVEPEAIGQLDAVQLFGDRARAVRPGFALDETNAPTVAVLCARLDGLPLAIELAAARARLMTPAEILARLDQRFRLLAGRQRDTQPRQQTLRAAIDWSHDLLGPEEQALFRRLAVFPGGWDLEAAEQVCADEALPDWEILELLAQLVDKSLVLAEPEAGTTRYRYLESLRFYALERLTEAGEEPVLRDRQLDWCEGLAALAAAELEGPRQPEWLASLVRELDNFRAALDRAGQGIRPETGLRIAADMGPYWFQQGQATEARRRLLELLEAAPGAEASIRARAWRLLGVVAMLQGDPMTAGDYFAAAGRSAEVAGDLAELTRCRAQHAWQCNAVDDRESARSRWRQAEAGLSRDTRAWDRALVAMCGGIVLELDDVELSLDWSQQALEGFRASGDPWSTAVSYNNVGWALTLLDRNAEAIEQLERGSEIAESLDYPSPLVYCLTSLGRAARQAGRPDLARDSLHRALLLMRRCGLLLSLAECLSHLAALELGEQRDQAAARLLGAVEAVLEGLGQTLANADPEGHARLTERTRSRLGEAAYTEAFAIGRSLDIDQALELGLRTAETGSGGEAEGYG